MKQILVTANDTGVGKTWVSSRLVCEYLGQGLRVGYVKVVETGVPEGGGGDAETVQAANPDAVCQTLLRFKEPLAPLAAAEREGGEVSIARLARLLENADSAVDVRIIEGAGGVAVPLDADGRDWLDLALHVGVDSIVAVVEDRLGAINQARLLESYLQGCGIEFELRLNCVGEVCPEVREVNCKALEGGRQKPESGRRLVERQSLQERSRTGMLRELDVHRPAEDLLNLSGNDYLGLARHPKVIQAARDTVSRWGCSASASPLVTGFLPIHHDLETLLCQWHGFSSGMVWTAGFQANRAVLGLLPQKTDLVLADRLVHRSMLSGAMQGRATFRRYRHLDLEHLEDLLKSSDGGGRVFVATESVFSMDGDAPDLPAIAGLREKYGFTWILDEAHALGWHGPTGAGLAEETGVGECVDILVGTLGKALGSQGAYVLFRNPDFRERLVNFSEDFIYSTYMSPASAGAALAAVDLVREMQVVRTAVQAGSRSFRACLRDVLPGVPDGDSPIVPVVLGPVEPTKEVHRQLLESGILTGFIRPPTVPQGTSRLRISLQSSLDFEAVARQVAARLGKEAGA